MMSPLRSSSPRSSLTFFSFWRGRITSLMPARLAASTFSLMPPTGSTLPCSVISPVIDTSLRTARQLGHHRRDHGHARGRTVLGNGARRHVHVQLGVLEEVRIDLPLVGVR